MKPQITIDTYIAGFPHSTQKVLEEMRQCIHTTAPDAQEAMRYGIPTFQLGGKNLVHFAGFTHHIGFYPTPSAILAFKKELSLYKLAKGSVQFPLDRPIPFDIVERMVQFRVREVSGKTISHP